MEGKSETLHLLHKTNIKHNITRDSVGVNDFLDNERKTSEGEQWNKLNKTIKLDKINEFVDVLTDDNNLSSVESDAVKTFIINCLDRKQLQCVKDVVYDKVTGKIKSIPNLIFNTGTRKFTLKRNEKRDSTLKSLGPGKTRKKTMILGQNVLGKKPTTTTAKKPILAKASPTTARASPTTAKASPTTARASPTTAKASPTTARAKAKTKSKQKNNVIDVE
jgi:hypothetical protein